MKKNEGELFQKVRICLTSSSFITLHQLQTFKQTTGRCIQSIYCSSEAGAISFNGCDKDEIINSTVGRSFQETTITILNGDDKEAKVDEVGEICVQGNHLSCGYYRKEELWNTILTQYGVRTGDLGSVDENGFIKILGRVQDTINVGGYLVVPTEVEAVIMELDYVKDVVVYGSTDQFSGQSVSVKIVVDRDDVTSNQILEYCSDKLSNYKLPRKIEFVKELETSRYGKKIRNFHESSDNT